MSTSQFEPLQAIVHARRSVRAFLPEPVPPDVLDACLDLALLSPNSQNLEPWQFVVVRSAEMLRRLREDCLHQAPAEHAPELVVAVARPDFWRDNARRNLAHHERAKHERLVRKYRWIVPVILEDGPRHMLGPLKALIAGVIGLWRPMYRGPFGYWGHQLWATKTTALACQTLMLALTAAGYASCPMEGFDEPRVKRLLGLPREARVVMVLAIGRLAPGGISEQLRFDRELFVSYR